MKPRRIKGAYDKPKAGEWIVPIRKGYRFACCDCGLVHRMDFHVLRRKNRTRVLFRVFLAPRSTAAMRRRPHAFVRRPLKQLRKLGL